MRTLLRFAFELGALGTSRRIARDGTRTRNCTCSIAARTTSDVPSAVAPIALRHSSSCACTRESTSSAMPCHPQFLLPERGTQVKVVEEGWRRAGHHNLRTAS